MDGAIQTRDLWGAVLGAVLLLLVGGAYMVGRSDKTPVPLGCKCDSPCVCRIYGEMPAKAKGTALYPAGDGTGALRPRDIGAVK